MSSAFPSLGVRIDALGAEQATRKVQAFGKSVGRLPKDMSEAGRSSRQLTVNMQKMSFAMFGASLAITTTVTSLSRLDRAAQKVDKTQVALARGIDLVARKELNLNRILARGERQAGELAIAQSELSTAYADVSVKTRELEIVTGEVSDTYINFAASLGASVLFAVTAFFSAVKGLNLEHAKGAIKAAGHAVSIGLIRTSIATTGPAVQGLTVATQASTISMIKATFAAHGLAAGIKAIFLSLGPLGIAIAAGTALLALYATNVGGVGDKINALLGITEDVTSATDDLVPSMNDLNNAMIGVQETAPLLGKTLSDIGQQIRFIAATAPAAAAGIQQIQAQAGVGGVGGGGRPGVAIGGGTLSRVGGGTTPLGIPAIIGGTPTVPFAGFGGGSLDLSALPGPTLRAAQINEQMQALENTMDRILRTSRQLESNRSDIRKILAATKNDSEAIAIIEELIVQKKQLALELDGEAADEMQRAAESLERALFIEELIIQRKREQLGIQKEQTKETNKSVNLLFDFLFARGRVGQSTVFGRSGGGAAGLGGGSFGAGGQFLGFQTGPGAIIGAGGQTFQSRINNPSFGQTLGGGGSNAINTFLAKSGGNFANAGFAAGGAGVGGQSFSTPGGNKKIRSKEALLIAAVTGIGAGRLGRSEVKDAMKIQMNAGVKAVNTAVSLGLLASTPAELFRSGLGIGSIINIAQGAIDALESALRTRGAAVGITDIGVFGADSFSKTRKTKSGVQMFRKTLNRISDANEIQAVITRVTEAEERARLIDELQRIINRRITFNKFLAAEGPGAVSGTGVSLIVDITPLANALEQILSGVDHNQFISLTGQNKI